MQKFIIMQDGIFFANNIANVIGARNVKNGGNFTNKGEAEAEAARLMAVHGYKLNVMRIA